ncbi:MAG: F(420)H(2) dehydrogenase subunit N [Methanoregula sp. PtaU1.Bin051]|nr:MAG: F(420)H(2) dehydrogenase subunit N [Methanoregula sp. PtaU1.Bin051]
MMPAEPAATMPVFIALGGVVIYGALRIFPAAYRTRAGTLTALWLALAFLQMLYAVFQNPLPPNTSYLGLTTGLLITGIGALAVFASQDLLDPKGPIHLYHPLVLFALAGAVAVGFAQDLFTIFVAVELSAVPVYALVAYRYQEDPAAIPAAMKYLILGVAGTITALLGVSILYLAGHTLRLPELPAALAGTDQTVLLLAAVLILLGYGVKLAIVPLHTWLPDAYARAPVGVTAILVGATKTGVLVAMFLSLSALPFRLSLSADLGMLVIFFAILTMTAGNLLALNQQDLRYILAYSSVAQMGYVLLGFGMGMLYDLELGFTAGLYYAIAYGIMKAGSFMAADLFGRAAGSFELKRMRGIGAGYPLLGISFAIFILGLSGVPFTCGFLGKLLLEQAGMVTSMLSGVVLALILALNSFISLGYYVPALSALSFRGADDAKETVPEKHLSLPASAVFTVVLLAVVTAYLGLFPESFGWITRAAQQLFPWGVV